MTATAASPAVRERPILFSGPMVRAIVDGRKTQTRRVIMCPLNAWHINRLLGDWPLSDYEEFDGHVLRYEHQTDVDDSARGEIRCPFGVAGDRLYVREAWGLVNDAGYAVDPSTLCYRADNASRLVWPRELQENDWTPLPRDGWRPSIHMPRWLSRLTLEIIEVRVDRIQAISEEDAQAEGAEPDTGPLAGYTPYKSGFAHRWQQLNAKRGFGWDVNPFVWAVTFRRVDA